MSFVFQLLAVDAGNVHSIPAQTSFVVVALFESVVSGTFFSRRESPAHVTLAANFAIDGPVADIVSAVRCAGALTEPLVVQFAGSTRFGPHRDIPVQLVQPARVSAVNSRLADRLEPLPGFVAEQPAYWRNGYRPHLTLSSTITAEEGVSRSVCCVAVAQLLEDTAMIVAGFDIPENWLASNPTALRDDGSPVKARISWEARVDICSRGISIVYKGIGTRA